MKTDTAVKVAVLRLHFCKSKSSDLDYLSKWPARKHNTLKATWECILLDRQFLKLPRQIRQ